MVFQFILIYINLYIKKKFFFVELEYNKLKEIINIIKITRNRFIVNDLI